MLQWIDYARMSVQELARHDIAAVNLACAAGLPGSEQIDVGLCLNWLDQAAAVVERYTRLCLPQFEREPQNFGNSLAQFQMTCMATVLQRHLHVGYNPTKVSPDVPFDAADCFIHGVIQGPGGTCGTLPVVYIAIGRRLGYPLKLVQAKGTQDGAAIHSHGFARWDGRGELFNIETTGRGFCTQSDDYYRTGRYEISPLLEKQGNFLVSKTPRMELAAFLSQRGFALHGCNRLPEVVDAYAWASALDPADILGRDTLIHYLNMWTKRETSRRPAGFPQIIVTTPQRRFPGTLDRKFECSILGAEATQIMLDDGRWEKAWWAKMRRGERPEDVPSEVWVEGRGEDFFLWLPYGRRMADGPPRLAMTKSCGAIQPASAFFTDSTNYGSQAVGPFLRMESTHV